MDWWYTSVREREIAVGNMDEQVEHDRCQCYCIHYSCALFWIFQTAAMQLNYTKHHVTTDTPNDPEFVESYFQQRQKMNDIVEKINEILLEMMEEVNYQE